MEQRLKKVGEMSFWIAFVMELMIVIVDKSAYINPYESMLFRLTFVLFGIKIVTTKYAKKEWLCIIVFGAIAVLSYLVNERDEAVRAVVFIASCKDIDLKKMLKVVLSITLTGMLVLFVLSGAGIFGSFTMTADYGRETVETRYCFGMGHPNSFSAMLFMVSTIAVYLGMPGIKMWQIAGIYVVNIVSFLFTDSNTALIVITAFIAGTILLKYCDRLNRGNMIYVMGAVLFMAIVLFSIYGAKVGNGTPLMYRLDKVLNGRFEYAYIHEAARLENWKLFAAPDNQEFFDQGFIRLFYWYGIVPGAVYVAGNLYLIWQAAKKKEYMMLVIVLTYSVFSIMEAHLISVYLLRNYLLLWLGHYWYQPFRESGSEEMNLWEINKLLGKV